MIGPNFRPSNNFTTRNEGVKPKSNPEPKQEVANPPAKQEEPKGQPPAPSDKPNPFVTDGLDPKTQFLTTQGLNNKRAEVNPKDKPGETENKPGENKPTDETENKPGENAPADGTEGVNNKPGEAPTGLDAETQAKIKDMSGGDPKLESALTDFATKNPEAFKNAGDQNAPKPPANPETDPQIENVAGDNKGLSGMLKNLASQNPDAFQQLLAMLERLMDSSTEQPKGGNKGNAGNGNEPAAPFAPPSPGNAGNAGNAGNTGGGGHSGGGGEAPAPTGGPKGGGNAPAPAGNKSGVPDDQDENGLTAEQLNTTGPAPAVSRKEIEQAANGDKEISDLLTKMDQDPEGHKALRLALDKGTTYKRGELEGNVVGLTEYGGGKGPVVTLENLTLDTAAHETAHAAYQDMSHAEVYRFGHRVEQNLGG